MKTRLPFLLYALRTLILVSLSAAYTQLPDEALKAIPRPGDQFNINNGKLLSQILQPRVPGSPGSTAVLNHFAGFFGSELPEWTVTYQNSSSKVAVLGNKEMPFVNMIATRDPPWSSPGEVGYLTLVAHYDSLMKPEGFIGAIDSAAPCAMLMHTAKSLEDALTKKWAGMVEAGDHEFEEHKGLQIILLDGEEAFDTWSDLDSIYGAKSLAAEMESTYHPALSTYHNALSTIHLFLLLDLLGSRNPKVPSYFKVTHWAYKKMADLERRLRDHSLFESSGSAWFYDLDKSNDRWMGGMIGDDHVPFMARGVDVLHLIPSPFPPVWHKMSDDGEHLDMDTTEDWAVLVTAFAAEWMDLGSYMGVNSDHKRATDDDQIEKIISKTEFSFVTKNLKPIRSIMRSYHLRSEQSRCPKATLPYQPQLHIVKAVGDSNASESCMEVVVAAVQRASFIGMEYTRFALGLIATELEQ